MKTFKWLTPAACATALAVGAYYLKEEKNRNKLLYSWNHMIAVVTKRTRDDEKLWDKIGNSDPYNFEDQSMLDEGATYSVNYFNKKNHRKT